MGYSTDFIGHIDIHPRLNIAEQRYLHAFASTRHYRRAEGPYAVPGNPMAEERGCVAVEEYNWNGRRPARAVVRLDAVLGGRLPLLQRRREVL